jgi:hypothetical protein
VRSLLRRLGPLVDKALDAVVWLHDRIMLFVCLFWLLPLIALVVVSAFVYDLRPLLRGSIQGLALYSLVGLPLWFGLCLYAEFTATPAAHRIQHLLGRLPVYVGYVLLGVGGLLWLLGII